MPDGSLGFVITVAGGRLSVSQNGLHQQSYPGPGGEVVFLSDLPLPDLRETATAVLAKGTDALGHIPGNILTFAIREGATGSELIAARDIMGSLPLYVVSMEDGAHVFLSSLQHVRQACGRFPLRVNHGAIPEYLLYRHVVGPRTLFEGISAPLPGHALVMDGGENRHEPYFDLKSTFKGGKPDGVAPKLSSRLYESLARESNGKRIGLMFSGGLDSSWLAYAHRHSGMSLYTISFPGRGESDFHSAYAEAKALQRKLQVVRLERASYASQLPAAIATSGLPVDHPNFVGRRALFMRAAEDGVERLLGGDGADSIFGGSWHNSIYKSILVKRFFPESLGRLPLPGRRGRKVSETLASSIDDLIVNDTHYPPALAAGFIRGPSDPTGSLYALIHSVRDIEPMDRAFFMSLMTTLSCGSAIHTALAWSSQVGIGYPYLNRDIVELTNGISGHRKLSGFKPKSLLIEACRNDVPARILNRKKCGLPVPLQDFTLGDGGLLRYRELLQGNDCMSASILDLSGMDGILKRFDRSQARAEDFEFFWVLLNLELWLRLMVRGESIA